MWLKSSIPIRKLPMNPWFNGRFCKRFSQFSGSCRISVRVEIKLWKSEIPRKYRGSLGFCREIRCEDPLYSSPCVSQSSGKTT